MGVSTVSLRSSPLKIGVDVVRLHAISVVYNIATIWLVAKSGSNKSVNVDLL